MRRSGKPCTYRFTELDLMLALSLTQTTMTAVGDTICKAEKGHL